MLGCLSYLVLPRDTLVLLHQVNLVVLRVVQGASNDNNVLHCAIL